MRKPSYAKTSATVYYLYEVRADGTEVLGIEHTDRKLVEHAARKGNKMRQPGQEFPRYEVRVAA